MDDLGDFFSLLGEGKKKEKEKTKEIIGEVSLSDLFTSLKEEKKRAKQKFEEKEEKRKKDAKIFENLFFDKPQEPVKTDDWKQNYTPTEIESIDIISPEPLQPSPGAEKFEEEIAELEQKQEELSENVDRWKDNLDVLVPKEEQITEEEDSLNRLTREVDMLRKMLYQTIQKVEVQGGGGEVNLQFLDDVDRDSAMIPGRYLQYDGVAGIWTGGSASHEGDHGNVDLGPLTNIAAASTTSITNGMSLIFDAPTGQFIATSAQPGNATSFNGIPIAAGTPPNDGVLTFDNTTNMYVFKTPFNIVDLGDGVQDGLIDYGEFE